MREVCIEAAFREVSLESIAVGDPVEIVLDILPPSTSAGPAPSRRPARSSPGRRLPPLAWLAGDNDEAGWHEHRAAAPPPPRSRPALRFPRQCVPSPTTTAAAYAQALKEL
jgi:hypothetical protein